MYPYNTYIDPKVPITTLRPKYILDGRMEPLGHGHVEKQSHG